MATRTFATCCSTCPSLCKDVHSPLCVLVLQLSSGAQGCLLTHLLSVVWYLSAGSGTSLFWMLKIPVASPTQEAYRARTLQLHRQVRPCAFRLSGLVSLEDMENLTLLTWITEVHCVKLMPITLHLKCRLESRVFWTLLLRGGNGEEEKRREECLVLFLISLFAHFLLSPGTVCFSQVHAGSSSSLSFFPLGSSDVNGKCKHADELTGKKEATRGAYLNFAKAFSKVLIILVWCD